MSQPGPSKGVSASSFFSSQPAIRIPTFQSPTVKRTQPAQPVPQTRDEERQARLKGPAGQWDNLNKLLPKGPQPLPSFGKRLGAPPPSAATAGSETSKSKAKTPRKSLSAEKPEKAGIKVPTPAAASKAKSEGSVKKRKSNVVAPTFKEKEENSEQPVKKKRKSSVAAPPSAPKSTRKSSAAVRPPSPAPLEVREDIAEPPVKKKRKSSVAAPKRTASPKKLPPPPPPLPAPIPAPAKVVKKRNSSVKQPARDVQAEEEEMPIASTSQAVVAPPTKLKKRKSAVKEKARKAGEDVAPAKKKAKLNKATPASQGQQQGVAEPESAKQKSVEPASAPINPPPSKSKKRVRISEVLSSPRHDDVAVFSDFEANHPLAEQNLEDSYGPGQISPDEEESDDGEEGIEGGKKQGGTKVRTERLNGNKGRLNAVDIAYGGVSKLLRRKMDALQPSRALKSLSRYSINIQTLLLTRSDQLSTLASASSAVSAAKARAKQLRVELLDIQRARAGVGRSMREEEQDWRESRKSEESTRELHAFLNDLSSASMDWQDATVEDSADLAPSTETNVQRRLERLASLLGPPGSTTASHKKIKGKGRAEVVRSAGLVGRVERLHAELRMEKL